MPTNLGAIFVVVAIVRLFMLLNISEQFHSFTLDGSGVHQVLIDRVPIVVDEPGGSQSLFLIICWEVHVALGF